MYHPTLVVWWCSTPSSIMSLHYNVIILSFHGPLQMFSFGGGGGASLVAQMVKESACNGGDLGSIPGSGRSLGGGNGYPLQYSCLENSMERGAWRATVHLQMFLLFCYYACLFCSPQWNFKNPEDWQYFSYIFLQLLEQKSAHMKFTKYPLFAQLVINRSFERLKHLVIGKTSFLLDKCTILLILK